MDLPQLDTVIHLRAGGVSLVAETGDGGLPAIAHWGADLGNLSEADLSALVTANVPAKVANSLDEPLRVSLLPEHHVGWTGRPGISGHHNGVSWSPKFSLAGMQIDGSELTSGERVINAGAALVSFVAVDAEAQLELRLDLQLLPSGLVRSRASVSNSADATYFLDELSLALPVPLRAGELLDFAGHWGGERAPQRREITVGTHLRENRKGRTGHDAATVLNAGTPGFNFGSGEIWAVHVGFSGNHRHFAERTSNGLQVLGGGELLLPGEVRLGPADSYQGPWIYGSYSVGLDAGAHRFHDYLRSRPQHPRSSRPVTLNVWEAVYFDHDFQTLADLADTAASIGVERFVLDDGWFTNRRSDHAGLGDWYVDEQVWPDGLTPIVERVRARGMEFGLWFEPEMVSPDSNLARSHPEWILATGSRLPVLARHQQVLNLGIPAAYDYVLGRLRALIDEYRLSYLKWDHNRDLIDAGTTPHGEAGVHEQTLAVYRMLAALKREYPGLEIESCSSGGARVDLGVLEFTDRVWVSDNNDPLDRQRMVRWTGQLLPMELLGAHVASPKSHTSGRTHELEFRAATAIFGHFGIEWNLASASATELEELAEWVALYKQHRPLLHSGRTVRADSADPAVWVHGVVSDDKSTGLFAVVKMAESTLYPSGRFTLPGLDASTRYRIDILRPSGDARSERSPAWVREVLAGRSGFVVSGAVLTNAGLQTPQLNPEQLLLLTVTAEISD